MPNRSWFYADRGQQQGPFPEAQFRDLIAKGMIRADTLIDGRIWDGRDPAAYLDGFAVRA